MRLNRRQLRNMILKEMKVLNENAYVTASETDKAAACLGYLDDYLNRNKKTEQLDFKPALEAFQNVRDGDVGQIKEAFKGLSGKNKMVCEKIPTYFDGSHEKVKMTEEDFKYYLKRGKSLSIS